MTAKEYLSQAYRLDLRIQAKLEQVASLNALATRCSGLLTGMPKGPRNTASAMADTIDRIVDLQVEINGDIDRLVDLKREIVSAIKSVGNAEHEALLEKRYLCFMSWERIASDLGYSVQHTFRLHDAALKKIPLKLRAFES